MKKRNYSVTIGWVITILTLLILFVIAETTGRWLAQHTQYVKRGGLPVIIPHTLLGAIPKPGSSYKSKLASITINSRGFRGKNFEIEKPEDYFRIFVLGGSTTFGFFPSISSDATTFPAQLENLLNKNKPDKSIRKYEVINAGVPGYSVRTSLVNLATRIIHYDPDMIIIYHNNNDAVRYGNLEELKDPLSSFVIKEPKPFATFFEAVFGWSYVYQELSYRLQWINFGSESEDATDSFRMNSAWELQSVYPERFRTDLRNIVNLAQFNKITPVLVTQAIAMSEKTDFSALTKEEKLLYLDRIRWHFKNIPEPKVFEVLMLYDSIIRQVADRSEVILVDGKSAVPKTSEYHRDWCHLTDKGAGKLAQAIFERLSARMSEADLKAQGEE